MTANKLNSTNNSVNKLPSSSPSSANIVSNGSTTGIASTASKVVPTNFIGQKTNNAVPVAGKNNFAQELQKNSQVKGSYGNWNNQNPNPQQIPPKTNVNPNNNPNNINSGGSIPRSSIASTRPFNQNTPPPTQTKSINRNATPVTQPSISNTLPPLPPLVAPPVNNPSDHGIINPYQGHLQQPIQPHNSLSRQFNSPNSQNKLHTQIESPYIASNQYDMQGQKLPYQNAQQYNQKLNQQNPQSPQNQPNPQKINQTPQQPTQNNATQVVMPSAKSNLPSTVNNKNQPPVAIDKNSPEYLKTLNSSDLRKEVIKTEIEIQKALIETEKSYREGVNNVRDLICPSAARVNMGYLELNTKLVRSFFVLTYPRVIMSGWLEGLVNADIQLDISIFVFPRDSSDVLRELRGKVGKIQASLQLNAEQGKARDPQLETAYRDVEGLRDAIQQGVEKFFRVGVYLQIYANTPEELEKVSQAVEGILSQQNILTKRAALQMDDGFNACLPILKDDLDVVTNMNTSPLSACFPFVSSDLSSDSGILYGINRHNSSLIIFDRFELENANSLVFATSGAGKSYAVKLEILRSRMMGVNVIVIDPEQEYKVLADSLGGAYINMSLNSSSRINPFDLPKPLPGESTADIIRSAIIDLMGLMNLMLGKLNPTEVSVMEKAITEAYAKKDINNESDLSKVQAPTMADLVEILQGIVGGESLAQRLYRYTEGTFAGIFNKQTNININNDFIVFSIRDLQETLRPIAMYILLKYVWTEIRSELKKRILAIDEAWILMQYEDSARFLYGLAKRARKYYLGITTISQDVTDFLSSPLGKPIVTNAAMKVLLKQSTAAIDQVADTFALTGGEKQVLLQSEVGQGIFFAGPRHVAIEIIAFPTEHKIITSNPKDILELQNLAK
jgi:conjugal transfer ATP-binding protein TraC